MMGALVKATFSFRCAESSSRNGCLSERQKSGIVLCNDLVMEACHDFDR